VIDNKAEMSGVNCSPRRADRIRVTAAADAVNAERGRGLSRAADQ
jgi:hypothetical protein